MIKLKDLLDESKYKALAFADVVDDIIKDKRLAAYSQEQPYSNTIDIHVNSGGQKEVERIASMLKKEYGVDGIKMGRGYLSVPSHTIIEK